ncbi:MAG: transposase [Acutalibacter sp.]|nr:transposase [Acutalibacter sp.]
MIQKNERRRYASDLSDSQWSIIEPLFPPAGSRSKWEKRELVNAVPYFVDNGCKWRNLPHDFAPYTTVANFYYGAIRSGLWEKIRAALVERVRTDAGRNADPSYTIIDSQSVKPPQPRKNAGLTEGKNKRAQTAHRSRYHGKSSGGSGSCRQYT